MEFTQETSTTNLWLIDLKREALDTPAKCLSKIQVYVLMIKLLVLVLCRSGWKTFSRRTRLRKQTLILWPKKLTRRSLTASNCEQVVKWMISLANNRVSKTPTRWFQIWNLDTDHLGSHTHTLKTKLRRGVSQRTRTPKLMPEPLPTFHRKTTKRELAYFYFRWCP